MLQKLPTMQIFLWAKLKRREFSRNKQFCERDEFRFKVKFSSDKNLVANKKVKKITCLS